MIKGVEIKQLKTFKDERGFFREVIRSSDEFFLEGFAQWSHSFKQRGYFTEQFHVHQNQVDWWYVPLGQIVAVLFDTRQNSDGLFLYYELGQSNQRVLKIPPGVAHGFKVLDNSAHLCYITSQEYNPDDEGRLDLYFDWSEIE